jgi:carboxypeptidase C (cathepsin A)
MFRLASARHAAPLSRRFATNTLIALWLAVLAQALAPVQALAQEAPEGHPAIPPAPPFAAPASPAAQPSGRSASRQGADAPGKSGTDKSSEAAARSPAAAAAIDATTRHTVTLAGRSLSFAATVGTVRLSDDAGQPEADIEYIYYRLDGADAAMRPIAFLFNGGPGSASAYLHLGAAGPWRISMLGPDEQAASLSDPAQLTPNDDTWLDFADLVFIDPAGTGWSRLLSNDDKLRKRYFSVNGDASSVARAIRLILQKHERLASPHFIVGESYGGIRAPRVTQLLTTREGVGVRGLALISPVLDTRESGGASILQYAFSLPSMAAVARAAKGPVAPDDLADVERYAGGEMTVDLLRGQADAAATGRLADHVAALTGIDRAEIGRLAGRLSTPDFRRAFDRAHGRVAGRYDASLSGYDPYPDTPYLDFSDPSSEPLIAPLTSAMTTLATGRLGWRPEGLYRLDARVIGEWDWGRGFNPPGSLTYLREILALDPKLKLLIGHGLFDLATPYFATRTLLAQLPDLGRERVRLTLYAGGHMFYARAAPRRAFRAEVEAMIAAGR